MTWDTVLDLGGVAAHQVEGRWREVELPGGLAGCVKLVTDYQGARLGVESVSGQVTAYAPIIEKQLREEGVIDDLAEVLVHSVDRRGSTAAVFYTVIPEGVARKYRDWAGQYKDHLFVYPLAAVLLGFAKKSGLRDGALVFAHESQVTVLVLRAGQVVAADSMQYAGTLGAESGRIAQRVWAMCLAPADAAPASWQFEVVQDAWQSGPDVAMLVSALEERARTSVGGGISLKSSSDPSAFLADLPLSMGQASTLDRGLYYCKAAVPWVAGVLTVCLLASLAAGLYWLMKRNELRANLDGQKLEQVAGLSEKLKSAVKDAEQIDPDLKRLKQMLDARERAKLIPPLQELLADVRGAAADGVQVSMIGAVSSKEGGLISLTFRGKSLENSFESERLFIRELESRGYKVVKRDVASTAEGSMFKLSIIRSR